MRKGVVLKTFFLSKYIVYLSFLIFANSLSAAVVYTLSTDGKSATIELNGKIDENMLQYLKSYLKHIKERNLKLKHNLISLNSNGGNPISAMRIGRLIRSENIGTIVKKSSICDSACIFILMGGVERMPFGEISVHRPASNDISKPVNRIELERYIADNKTKIEEYTKEMGQSFLLADAINSTPNWWYRVLEPIEMRRWGLEGITQLVEIELSLEMGVVYKKTAQQFNEFMYNNWSACRQRALKELDSILSCLRVKMDNPPK